MFTGSSEFAELVPKLETSNTDISSNKLQTMKYSLFFIPKKPQKAYINITKEIFKKSNPLIRT